MGRIKRAGTRDSLNPSINKSERNKKNTAIAVGIVEEKSNSAGTYRRGPPVRPAAYSRHGGAEKRETAYDFVPLSKFIDGLKGIERGNISALSGWTGTTRASRPDCVSLHLPMSVRPSVRFTFLQIRNKA